MLESFSSKAIVTIPDSLFEADISKHSSTVKTIKVAPNKTAVNLFKQEIFFNFLDTNILSSTASLTNFQISLLISNCHCYLLISHCKTFNLTLIKIFFYFIQKFKAGNPNEFPAGKNNLRERDSIIYFMP